MTGDAVIELMAGAPGRDRRRRGAGDPRASLRGVGRPGRVHARRPHRRRGQRRARRRSRPSGPWGSPDESPVGCPCGWPDGRSAAGRAARCSSRCSSPSPWRAWPWPSPSSAPTPTSPLEEWQRTYGQADAAGYELDVEADAARGLADRSPCARTWMRLKAADGARADAELTDLPLDDPLTAGIHDLVSGRAPSSRRRGRPVDARSPTSSGVEVGRRAGARASRRSTATVVGEVEPVGCLSCETAVFAPGGPARRATCGVGEHRSATLLIDLPDDLTLAELSELRAAQPGGNLMVRELSDPAETSSATTGAARRCAGASCSGAVVLTVVGHRDLGRLRGRRSPAARHARPAVGERCLPGDRPHRARAAGHGHRCRRRRSSGWVWRLPCCWSGSRWSSASSTSGSTATTVRPSEVGGGRPDRRRRPPPWRR